MTAGIRAVSAPIVANLDGVIRATHARSQPVNIQVIGAVEIVWNGAAEKRQQQRDDGECDDGQHLFHFTRPSPFEVFVTLPKFRFAMPLRYDAVFSATLLYL